MYTNTKGKLRHTKRQSPIWKHKQTIGIKSAYSALLLLCDSLFLPLSYSLFLLSLFVSLSFPLWATLFNNERLSRLFHYVRTTISFINILHNTAHNNNIYFTHIVPSCSNSRHFSICGGCRSSFVVKSRTWEMPPPSDPDGERVCVCACFYWCWQDFVWRSFVLHLSFGIYQSAD